MSTVTIIDGLRIRTNMDNPPIPTRRYDWAAWIDGEEESNIQGRGETESDAVAELLQTLEEQSLYAQPTSCSHPDTGCDCTKCKCGVILDSKSPLSYFGKPVDQCWRCFQESCEPEAA